MTATNSALNLDVYKIFHPSAYKKGTKSVHSNFTNRFNTHSNVPNSVEVMFLGLQAYALNTLIKEWNETFFNVPKWIAVGEYSAVAKSILGKEVSVKHLEDLHDLGYLPLEIRAVKEGTMVPYGIPSMTLTVTEDYLETMPDADMGWVANSIEPDMSAEMWGICTSGTTAYAYRKRLEQETSLNREAIRYMCHDFSYRGMFGRQAAAMSGFGHLTCFYGSDNVPAGSYAVKNYGADWANEIVMASVDATEHSVATSFIMSIVDEFIVTGEYGGITVEDYRIWYKLNDDEDIKLVAEIIYMHYLMTVVTPTGLLSLVCDSFDFWGIVKYALPALKEVIESRDGAVIVRPDSGDPVDVICGLPDDAWGYDKQGYRRIIETPLDEDGYRASRFGREVTEEEVKGLVQCLIELFGSGGTTKEGLISLSNKVGAIYGDSITLARQDEIIKRLLEKGYTPTVVLGIGSFTYQYVTRDTHGSAVKATSATLEDKRIAIFKAPKTDAAKTSAKGLLAVIKDNDGKLQLVQDCEPEFLQSSNNQLELVFRNGEMKRFQTLKDIRAIVDASFD